ncbi:MAG: hypothetical protein P8185_04540 [Deltaproteobacteria bacterium]|jgi:hypothetical protein
MVGLAGVSTLCSFSFGWTIGLPFSIVILVGMVYAFSALGDSPILSATMTESVSMFVHPQNMQKVDCRSLSYAGIG